MGKITIDSSRNAIARILFYIFLSLLLVTCSYEKEDNFVKFHSKISLGSRFFQIDSIDWINYIYLNNYEKNTEFKVEKSKIKSDFILINYENHCEFLIPEINWDLDFSIELIGEKRSETHYFSEIIIISGDANKKRPNRLVQYRHNNRLHKFWECDLNLSVGNVPIR